jgi:hypothetical protein
MRNIMNVFKAQTDSLLTINEGMNVENEWNYW